jgi:hypothetical protein
MSDTNCPYCGEPEETDTPSCITIYRCGTRIYPNGSSETPLICDLGRDLRREREAHNQTKRERDEARKHLKEIEEYGTDEINAAVDLRRNLAQALVDLDDMQYQRDFSRRNHALAVESMSVWKERAEKAERERDEVTTKLAELSSLTESIVEKASALIARWDQPSWKDTAPTAGFINALRNAVEAYEKTPK